MLNLSQAINFAFLSQPSASYAAPLPPHLVGLPEYETVTVAVGGVPRNVCAAPAGEADPLSRGMVAVGTHSFGGKTAEIFQQLGTKEPDPLSVAIQAPIPPPPSPKDNPFFVQDVVNYPGVVAGDETGSEVVFAYFVTLGPFVVWGHVDNGPSTSTDLDSLLGDLALSTDSSRRPVVVPGSPGNMSDVTQQDSVTFYSPLPAGTPPTGVSVDPSLGTPLSATFRYAGGFAADAEDLSGVNVVVTRANGLGVTVSVDGPPAELANLRQIAGAIAGSIAPGGGR